MLEMQAVQSGYGPSQVLFGVDLRIEAGQVVTLLGRNGMGKTTLLRTLLGQLPLRAGRMVFAGQDIAGWATDRIARAGVAIVPEGRQCFPNLTVREHLTAFVAHRNSGSPGAAQPWSPERVFALFPRLGERASNMGNQLSGGEQQMLAIGRALVTNPRLLILDEATEGLAPRIREEIWSCLAQLRAAGQTILVIDKYVERLLGLADRHLILERGKVVWSGDSAALDGDRALWERYLGV
ncbi:MULTISPECIES: ABC transporter ATP-binding protein [Delftia]|jgi:branched-chain amino acid transport system ATP-binding protein|uniref:ABC transporter ATP-binding protein n=1 Tax=Delftia TaxID=80865 RepID=UPI000352C61C|nr:MULTISPECIES: ABC transporter ATP-binding protein [Delftia]EPD34158.1 branched-chain amino acid transport system ATP-binding protein [Delftia acidovorans CCUG 274B]KAF1054655.1 MAG: High-affinity branched-chain amino acid transport ATP-binding protein LivF [Delftia tsuruhatensis]MCO5338500.1 ABC transporter ATP-binding protein [Delftia tsuruhatensis]MCR4548215.1 ABC transporter ATP-binding protein [Delftia tsuruhatensis]MDR6732917.1 branched-chain amino acid transport system ATP-binding pro